MDPYGALLGRLSPSCIIAREQLHQVPNRPSSMKHPNEPDQRTSFTQVQCVSYLLSILYILRIIPAVRNEITGKTTSKPKDQVPPNIPSTHQWQDETTRLLVLHRTVLVKYSRPAQNRAFPFFPFFFYPTNAQASTGRADRRKFARRVFMSWAGRLP
jgi:hypothetical protein